MGSNNAFTASVYLLPFYADRRSAEKKICGVGVSKKFAVFFFPKMVGA